MVDFKMKSFHNSFAILLLVLGSTSLSLGSSNPRVFMPIPRENGVRSMSINSYGEENTGSNNTYKTYTLSMPIDHFGFSFTGNYQMRYLVADQFWNRNGGPIFFYTGNEGDIELFCKNTGFMWDIAPEFRAMLVFAEHRYYGKSLPFGPDTYKDVSNLRYLSSEQALADFATLIKYLKETIPGAEKSRVVAFGGSYGGMLSAWLRIKYPNMVVGSLAASAPVWQFTGITPCNAFYDTTSKTWTKASSTCAANIRSSYQTLKDITAQAGGFKLLTSIFKLCTPLKTEADLESFTNFLVSMYINYAMIDYPYPANFLAPLPGWPINVACSFLSKPMKGNDLLVGISKVVNLYYNYTGQAHCINWNASDQTGLGYEGWNYQACTEMVMPLCSDGSGIFYKIPWDLPAFKAGCKNTFNVESRENWISLEYWGKALKSASNIIFSNGLLDPWSTGGVLQSISDSVVAIHIEDGAHHLDLRAANKLDTRSVKNARVQEKNIIKKWLNLTP